MVCAFREGKYKKAIFEHGTLVEEKEGRSKEKNGTLIEFLPDVDLFPDFAFDLEYVGQRLWRYAYLNAGLSLFLGDENENKKYYSENGLLDLLADELDGKEIYPAIHASKKALEFAFTHTDDYGDTYFSFVNGTYTSEGGTHLSAFREGILKGVNEFSGKKYSGKDVRDGIVGTLAAKIQEPVFESQTKNNLVIPI